MLVPLVVSFVGATLTSRAETSHELANFLDVIYFPNFFSSSTPLVVCIFCGTLAANWTQLYDGVLDGRFGRYPLATAVMREVAPSYVHSRGGLVMSRGAVKRVDVLLACSRVFL